MKKKDREMIFKEGKTQIHQNIEIRKKYDLARKHSKKEEILASVT